MALLKKKKVTFSAPFVRLIFFTLTCFFLTHESHKWMIEQKTIKNEWHVWKKTMDRMKNVLTEKVLYKLFHSVIDQIISN